MLRKKCFESSHACVYCLYCIHMRLRCASTTGRFPIYIQALPLCLTIFFIPSLLCLPTTPWYAPKRPLTLFHFQISRALEPTFLTDGIATYLDLWDDDDAVRECDGGKRSDEIEHFGRLILAQSQHVRHTASCCRGTCKKQTGGKRILNVRIRSWMPVTPGHNSITGYYYELLMNNYWWLVTND